METLVLEHTIKDQLEDSVRADLGATQARLFELREQRKELDAAVRILVADEKTLRRLVAVFDRARKAKLAA